MADDEPLADYLDRLIENQYVTAVRGRGYVSHSPLHSSVIDFIEDETTGRPHPIDDSADHFLLRQFDNARRDFPTSLSNRGEARGERRLRVQRWSDGYVGPGRIVWDTGLTGKPINAHRVDGHHYADEIHGEIGWRCFHGDPEWPCVECGHEAKHHREYPDGWLYCIGDDETCNCGNNIGR